MGRLSGYSVEETPAYSAFLFIRTGYLNYNRPGYTIEVGGHISLP